VEGGLEPEQVLMYWRGNCYHW